MQSARKHGIEPVVCSGIRFPFSASDRVCGIRRVVSLTRFLVLAFCRTNRIRGVIA